jgi:hypothetical protein
VPRQQASAEKSALRGIGQLRACEMRRYLVLAAQSLLIRVNRLKQPPQDRLLLWAGRLVRRKTRNVAVVAVAARLARIAWAVTAGNQPLPAAPRRPSTRLREGPLSTSPFLPPLLRRTKPAEPLAPDPARRGPAAASKRMQGPQRRLQSNPALTPSVSLGASARRNDQAQAEMLTPSWSATNPPRINWPNT